VLTCDAPVRCSSSKLLREERPPATEVPKRGSAVAGFTQDEIDITAQQNLLVVSGKKADEDDASDIHCGIANRSFERRFGRADHFKVDRAEIKDGMLAIDCVGLAGLPT